MKRRRGCGRSGGRGAALAEALAPVALAHGTVDPARVRLDLPQHHGAAHEEHRRQSVAEQQHKRVEERAQQREHLGRQPPHQRGLHALLGERAAGGADERHAQREGEQRGQRVRREPRREVGGVLAPRVDARRGGVAVAHHLGGGGRDVRAVEDGRLPAERPVGKAPARTGHEARQRVSAAEPCGLIDQPLQHRACGPRGGSSHALARTEGQRLEGIERV